MTQKRKGIKRHEALHSLSHHHTNALFVSLKLRRAGTEESKLTLDELKDELHTFWNEGGQDHFREEEEILLTAYAQYVDIDTIPEVSEILLDHVKIRSLIDIVLNNPANEMTAEMNRLGDLLEVHIRKEERILFPMIEKALPEEKLIELKPYFHEE